MWLTMRSIRSAGLAGMRAPARPSAVDEVWFCSRLAKNSRTWQSVGMDGQQDAVEGDEADRAGVDHVDRVLAALATAAPSSSIAATALAARRRKTSRSYADV